MQASKKTAAEQGAPFLATALRILDLGSSFNAEKGHTHKSGPRQKNALQYIRVECGVGSGVGYVKSVARFRHTNAKRTPLALYHLPVPHTYLTSSSTDSSVEEMART